ncbi:MAG: hypothetical protein N2578_04955, partial [Bdellovibrionaceae bacterium]|nr:hypothetical protein [Pseudobdellovibrionaceae bacterium]
QWTPLPKGFVAEVEGVFKEAFGQKIANGRLIIEGRIYPAELVFRLGYLEQGRLAQANFDISIEHSGDEKAIFDKIHTCVDAAGSLLLSWLEDEDFSAYPLTWQEFPFEGERVFVKFTTENSELEREANQILGQEPVRLFNEEVSEDALDRAQELSLEELRRLRNSLAERDGLESPEGQDQRQLLH